MSVSEQSNTDAVSVNGVKEVSIVTYMHKFTTVIPFRVVVLLKMCFKFKPKETLYLYIRFRFGQAEVKLSLKSAQW